MTALERIVFIMQLNPQPRQTGCKDETTRAVSTSMPCFCLHRLTYGASSQPVGTRLKLRRNRDNISMSTREGTICRRTEMTDRLCKEEVGSSALYIHTHLSNTSRYQLDMQNTSSIQLIREIAGRSQSYGKLCTCG
jgi:hypothetical protein